jgi:tRNA A-37 threonylcarbamoyl transferase component Bud32
MAAARICPQCSKPLPSDGPQGLCPECLLKAALAGQSVLESVATGVHDASPATATVSEAGARLKYFGDYELLEEIARGGMGVVWKARQTSLNRDVALKMIRAGALASPDEVQRFLREAEAAANLQHPNIVAIHEVGEHDGQHYFSMDYVAGRDLGALVKDGPLAPQLAARHVKIIAEAIHFAHQRGTLHRDLKPQNVLIDAADQPRITDFGLAKIMKDDSRLTQSGMVMGSPSYMPPEQAAGRQGDIGPASDVYSLGAMLYELLTGRPPFRGATVLDTLREVLEAESVAPRRLLATIPPDLETICLKCLEKSPTVRYPTARALAEELDRFLKGEPIQARPASAVRKVVSWARRHPNVLVAVAALVMVVLAFSVFYLWEENAFLRAQQADPSLARILGPRYESFRLWCQINGYVWVGGFVLLFVWRPLPIGVRTPTFAIAAGLILVGSGVMALVTGIQVYVWECEESWSGQIFGPWAGSLFSIECGLIILGMVIRHYHLVNYGPSSKSSRPLTAEQIEPIRRALEDDDWRTAHERYREAVPKAGWAERVQYLTDLRESLRAQDPDKFAPPPLTLATLNWKAMGINVLIEVVILGVVWFAAPPAHPVSAVSQFACTFLFGMASMAFMRVQGFWKRILLFAPALVVLILGEALVPLLVEESSHSFWSYFCGFMCGRYLIGFRPTAAA